MGKSDNYREEQNAKYIYGVVAPKIRMTRVGRDMSKSPFLDSIEHNVLILFDLFDVLLLSEL
jgi:hypothetical protein